MFLQSHSSNWRFIRHVGRKQILRTNDIIRTCPNLIHVLFQWLDQQLYRCVLAQLLMALSQNAAYLITVMNFIITSTPSEKNEGH